ncbi:MFS transporter [Parasphingopyxis sp.]|uniref:MFS transporter n=1 Tax=Parasphingopyxis sp. TaxID=1920299 RepID=UPI002614A8AF|nr:MFS transporter [Parasphingopyxis sp.]
MADVSDTRTEPDEPDRLTSRQWRVFVICGIIAMLDGFDVQAPAFAAPAIAEQWGIEVSAFGIVFTAGLLGLTISSLVMGAAGDRIGRRPALLISLVIMAIFSIASAFATGLTELAVMRFLVGLGLGGAVPNVIALTSEYAPPRIHSTVVTLMFVGFPFGAVVGGLASSYMIGVYGWESIFILGGVLPALLLPVVWKLLPESPDYLAARTHLHESTRRPDGSVPNHLDDSTDMRPTKPSQNSIALLFQRSRRTLTLLMWVVFFCNLMSMYLLISWLPVLLESIEFDRRVALMGTVLLNLGGAIGGIVIARCLDKGFGRPALFAAFFGAAAFIAMLGIAPQVPTAILGVIFLAGFALIGAQFGMNAFAALCYPTAIRSTGVGWALGVGRIGSIAGPGVGALLLYFDFEFAMIFLLLAIPSLICLLSFVGLRPSRSYPNS